MFVNDRESLWTWDQWCFTPQYCTVRLYRAGATWANEINFGMNHALGVGSIAWPVGLQSSVLSLCYDCPWESWWYRICFGMWYLFNTTLELGIEPQTLKSHWLGLTSLPSSLPFPSTSYIYIYMFITLIVSTYSLVNTTHTKLSIPNIHITHLCLT